MYSAANPPTSVTYNGVSMTNFDNKEGSWSFWYLYNPDIGTHLVEVTGAVGEGVSNHRGCSISYTGVAQTGFPDSSNYSLEYSSPADINTTVVTSGCWLVALLEGSCGNPPSYSETTNRIDRVGGLVSQQSGGNGYVGISDSNGTVGTGSQGFTYTFSGTPDIEGGGYVISIYPNSGSGAAFLFNMI